MNDQSDSKNKLTRVFEKIQEIVEKSEDGDYIYRGEPECNPIVSSNLYREYEKEIEDDSFDIKVVQQEIVETAREYLSEAVSDIEILTELQHHGGKTNLIDFTTDYLIALFFSCDGSHDQTGRVILLKKQSDIYQVIKPKKNINRVTSQKSVFVQSHSGFIDSKYYKTICIPNNLKVHMMDYLQKHHDIATKTIYNDLHGFIVNRRIHQSTYTEFYKGRTCQDRGDSAQNQEEKHNWYIKSIEHYSKTLELNPLDVIAYNNRGLAYHKKADFANALNDFSRVIALVPYYTEGYRNRAAVYSDKGEFNKAITDFKKVLLLKHDYDEVYCNLGAVYEKNREYDKAIENLNIAIKLKPDLAEAYYNLGIVYREMGNHVLELQNYNIAIKLKPDYPEAFNNRGMIYDIEGDHDKAIQDYNTTIKLNPNYANAYLNRGVSYASKGDHNKALKEYTTAIKLNPNYANAYLNRGVSYASKGDHNKAIQEYDCAIELKPDFAGAYCNRGEAWLHLKEWEKAKTDLNIAKDKGVDIIESFHNDYESIENFEQKNDIQLPEDIAEMLRRK